MDNLLDAAGQENEEAAKLRAFAEIIWKTTGLETPKPLESVDKERPFLPPMTWALFSAYRQVLNLPAAQIMAVRAGAGKKILADVKPLIDSVKAVLPHYSEYLDQFGAGGLSLLIEDLEEKLLAEIVASLESTASDDKTVTQAAVILKAAEKLRASNKAEIELPNFPAA
jgi:hypothetical protein